jgi:hypothetical protein
MGFEDTLPVHDDSAAWALEGAADSAAQQSIGISPGRRHGPARPRLLEAVPEFAFLAMPEQDLD